MRIRSASSMVELILTPGLGLGPDQRNWSSPRCSRRGEDRESRAARGTLGNVVLGVSVAQAAALEAGCELRNGSWKL